MNSSIVVGRILYNLRASVSQACLLALVDVTWDEYGDISENSCEVFLLQNYVLQIHASQPAQSRLPVSN